MKKPENYPYKDYIRIGWAAPVREVTEVDFVGHSWFFERSLTDKMFKHKKSAVYKDTLRYRQYKFAGEDMTLSFMCKKEGIPTYVPPHPARHRDLWGATPELSVKSGTDKSAVHQNPANMKRMNDCMNELLADGWETLSKEKPEYVKRMCFRDSVAQMLTKFIPGRKLRHYCRDKIKEFLFRSK